MRENLQSRRWLLAGQPHTILNIFLINRKSLLGKGSREQGLLKSRESQCY
jgi:hypothetical protein